MSDKHARIAAIKSALAAAVAGAPNDSLAQAADLLNAGVEGRVQGATASTRLYPFVRSTFTK